MSVDNVFSGMLNRIAGAFPTFGQEANGVAASVGEFMKPLQWFSDEVVSRPISTSALLLNPDYRGSVYQDGWGAFRKSWTDAADISPGQALMSLPYHLPGAPSWSGTEQVDTWLRGGVKPGQFGGIDPSDPKVRAQAFQSWSSPGKYTSFAADAAIQWYANPNVLAAHAVKPASEFLRGATQVTADNAPKIFARDAAALDKAQSIVEGQAAPKGPFSGRASALADLFQNRQNIPLVLKYMPVSKAANPGVVATSLAGAKDFNEFKNIWMAARGDSDSLLWLQARAPSIYEDMTVAQTELNAQRVARSTIPKIDLATGETTQEWQSSTEEINRQAAYVKDAIERNDWITKVLGEEQGRESNLLGQMSKWGVSPVAAINNARTGTAALRSLQTDGYWVDQAFRPAGEYGNTIQFLSWAGQHAPKGVVALNGVAASRFHDDVRDILEGVDMPADMVNHYVTLAAKQVTSDGRLLVLEQAQQDAARRLFKAALGDETDPVIIRNATKAASKYMKQQKAKVRDAVDEYRARGGYAYDVDSKTFSKIAYLESQGAQYVPTTDFRMLQRLIKDQTDAGSFRTFVTNVASPTGIAVLDGFQYLWKANVLLRLGAIPRNLGESWLATFAFTGRFAGNPFMGLRNAAANRYDRYAAKYGPDSPNPIVKNSVEGAESARELHGALIEMAKDVGTQRASKIETMAQSIVTARAGGGGFYEAAPQIGTRITRADVLRSIDPELARLAGYETPEGFVANEPLRGTRRISKEMRDLLARSESKPMGASQLRNRLRQLHGTSVRRYLRARQAEGNDIVARHPETGDLVPINDVRELTDKMLLPSKGSRIEGELPEMYVVPSYQSVMRHAPKPKVEARSVLDAEYPEFYGIYGDQWLDDMRDLHASIQADEEHLDEIHDDILTVLDHMKGRRPRPYAPGANAQNILRRAAGEAPVVAEGRYVIPGARQDATLAQIAERNISARAKQRLDISAYESQASRQNEWSRKLQAVNGSIKQYQPGDPLYSQASAEFANRMIRNSTFAKLLLSTEDPLYVTNWLLHDSEGQQVLRRLNLSSTEESDVLDWTGRAYRNLTAAYPNEALRATILEREITPQEVEAYLVGKQPDELVPTMARDYAPTMHPAERNVLQIMNQVVDGLYEKIWSLPEDRLARWPLYAALYKTEVQRRFDLYRNHLDTLDDVDANKFIQRYVMVNAREYATQMTKRVIYSSDTRNNMAEKMRFIAPFLQVTGNRLYFYGTQILENPVNMARIFLTWNAIGTGKDSSGNDIVGVHVPGFVAKVLNIEDTPDLYFQKSSLNLIQNGEPWWSPGFGPIVTVPLAEVLRRTPDNPASQKIYALATTIGMYPNGYVGNDAMDLTAATWMRRLRAENGPQYGNSQAMIATIEAWKFENGLRTTAPSQDEITAKNDALWGLRLFAAFTSPAQPQFKNDMVEHYTQIMREYDKKFGRDANAHFLQDYPEYYDLILNYSQNPTGIAATNAAVGREKKFGGVIDQLQDPSMAALVTNTPNDQGQFDQLAYQWEYGRPVAPGSDTQIRGSQSPQAALDNRITSRGWIMYRDAVKQRDALLLGAKQAGGSENIQAKSNLWIKVWWNDQKQKITRDTTVHNADGSSYSPWGLDYDKSNSALYGQRADSLRTMVHSKMADDPTTYPWMDSAKQYLAIRDKVSALLAEQKAMGGSDNISAKTNTWLAVYWDDARKQLTDNDPLWQEIATRYFTNDDLSTIPGGQVPTLEASGG